MSEGGPFCHHLPTAHHDPEEHEVLKVSIDDDVINLKQQDEIQPGVLSTLIVWAAFAVLAGSKKQ